MNSITEWKLEDDYGSLVGGAGDTELAYAAGCAVFEELLEHGLLKQIAQVSAYLEEKLQELKDECTQIKRICCKGLAVSIEFDGPECFASVQKKAKEAGLIIGSGENRKLVLRPPYVITKEDVDEVAAILQRVIQSC